MKIKPITVREVASLHPRTVENYQNHLPKRKGGKSMNGRIASLKVDARVWATALRLAKGDRSRLVVKSPTEVVVTNKSARVEIKGI